MTRPTSTDGHWLLSRRAFLALGVGAALAAQAAPTRSGGTGRRTASAALAPHLSPEKRASIVSVAIHPGVGITRVGNSADAFYFGPEVPGALPPSGTKFRDPAGAVARQAARFRLYGYDVFGKVVGEITAADAAIDWGVHLANRKAAWYQFSKPLDIPEATQALRRNRTITGAARSGLVADAGLHSTTEGNPVELNATVKGVELLLGELLTDAKGRLVVLPGLGAAHSWTGSSLITYANNDGWVDDMADGPVSATIEMDGRMLEAESAWVASGPPNYAPAIATGWRTLHDIVEDTWVTAGFLPAGDALSFRRDILPMFVRQARLQWVNAGILRDYGWKSPEDLSDPAFLAQLADASLGKRAFRRSWVRRFRNIDLGTLQPNRLPSILGDAAGFPPSSPRAWIGPTELQRVRLHEWGEGNFASDGITPPAVPKHLEDLPLQRRPHSLDRAALDGCLGDAFHPGCELTWPVRHASMWDAPYRLAVRPLAEPDYGPTLKPTEAVSATGPLAGNFPGSLTRWLAVPWMTDTINCLSGYQPSVDPYLDTFWPARVPNQVLTEADYEIVMNESETMAHRKAAFRRRKSFFRGMIVRNYHDTLSRMSNRWPQLGFVEARPGPSDGAFPARFAVEVDRVLAEPAPGFVELAPMFEPPDASDETTSPASVMPTEGPGGT